MVLNACATVDAKPVSDSTDRAEILSIMSSFFKAMEFKDVETARSLILPKGRYFSVSSPGGGYSIMTTEDYLQSLTKAGSPLLQERLLNPDVKINGNIASLWSNYHFYVGEKFDHCGVDIFDFINTNDGWKMVSSVFTSEKGQACIAGRKKYGDWQDGAYVLDY